MEKITDINGVSYEFVKEIPSDTRVKGWHVRVNGANYVVLLAPIPRGPVEASAYPASKLGKLENLLKPIFTIPAKTLQEGVDKLIEVVAAKQNVK